MKQFILGMMMIFCSSRALAASFQNVDLSFADVHCSLNESTALITGWLGQTKVVMQKATMPAPVCAEILAQISEKRGCVRVNLGISDVDVDEKGDGFWTSSHYKIIQILSVADRRSHAEICPY